MTPIFKIPMRSFPFLSFSSLFYYLSFILPLPSPSPFIISPLFASDESSFSACLLNN